MDSFVGEDDDTEERDYEPFKEGDIYFLNYWLGNMIK